MRKRLTALLLVVVMVMSVGACGSTKKGENGNHSDIKIGIVTDTGGVNDGSFNQSSWEGLQRAHDEMGISVKYLESSTDSDYIPNIETFIDEDYDLIICVGYQLAEALRTKATSNPEQKFAIIDDATNADMDNVACLMFEQSQASYLVGYAAGLTTETDRIGFVLGMSTETMHQVGYGFLAGVLDANPDATVLQSNANSFVDTAGGKTAANSMIANGADVIYHAAGGTGLGVIDACKEAGIWAIGVDGDQSVIAPDTILTSAMKRVDIACYNEAQAIIDSTFESGINIYTLADEGVDLAPTTDNLDKDVLDKLIAVKGDIVAGRIIVPSTKEDFEDKYGDVYELD